MGLQRSPAGFDKITLHTIGIFERINNITYNF